MVNNAQQGEVVLSPRRQMHREEQLLQEKVEEQKKILKFISRK